MTNLSSLQFSTANLSPHYPSGFPLPLKSNIHRKETMTDFLSIWPHNPHTQIHTSIFCEFMGCLLNLPSVVLRMQQGFKNKWTASLENNESFFGSDKDQCWPRAREANVSASRLLCCSGLSYRQTHPQSTHSLFFCNSYFSFWFNILPGNVLFYYNLNLIFVLVLSIISNSNIKIVLSSWQSSEKAATTLTAWTHQEHKERVASQLRLF